VEGCIGALHILALDPTNAANIASTEIIPLFVQVRAQGTCGRGGVERGRGVNRMKRGVRECDIALMELCVCVSELLFEGICVDGN